MSYGSTKKRSSDECLSRMRPATHADRHQPGTVLLGLTRPRIPSARASTSADRQVTPNLAAILRSAANLMDRQPSPHHRDHLERSVSAILGSDRPVYVTVDLDGRSVGCHTALPA